MLKSSTFHTLRFIAVFLLLTAAFYAYVGIVSPGGKTYSPFLDRYANVPAWLSYFICAGAKAALQLSGYEVVQKSANTIAIRGSRGVNIIWACLGFGVMSYWTAFITAHVAAIGYKLRWLFIGIGSIIVLNMIRIASIALANHYQWTAYKNIEPHFAFNVASYGVIFGLTFWFVYRYKYYSAKKPVSRHNRQAMIKSER